MCFIKKLKIYLDVSKILQTKHDNFDLHEDAKNRSLSIKVGNAFDGLVKLCENGNHQNIQLSLGRYTVILKYLHDYKGS
ncbi:hypothetical protein ES702_05285 [subsurface metagenome]